MLVVDPATLEIRGLVTIDAQGGKSSFSFTNLKENVGLADKEFAFKIPRGVDVVSASPRSLNFSAATAWQSLAVVCLFAGGCAASGALHRGRDAEHRQDYDLRRRRIHEGASPAVPTTATRGSRSSARSSARRRTTSARPPAGRDGQARRGAGRVRARGRAESRRAATSTTSCARRATSCARKIAVAREGKTELQTLIERSRDLPPPGLDLPAGVKMPASLTFRDASSRDVFIDIARFANISLIFDPAFRETPVTVDLRNASLEDALNTVAGATRTFFRVTAPKTIIVIPDTPAKRREYEEEIVRTFYLSNADLKETMDLLRHGPRRAAHLADDRHQRADHQGHARADRRGGARRSRRSTRRGPRSSSTSSCSRSIGRSCWSTGCRSPRPDSPRHQRHRCRSRPTRTGTHHACRRCAT